jgi:hypothetical protein
MQRHVLLVVVVDQREMVHDQTPREQSGNEQADESAEEGVRSEDGEEEADSEDRVKEDGDDDTESELHLSDSLFLESREQKSKKRCRENRRFLHIEAEKGRKGSHFVLDQSRAEPRHQVDRDVQQERQCEEWQSDQTRNDVLEQNANGSSASRERDRSRRIEVRGERKAGERGGRHSGGSEVVVVGVERLLERVDGGRGGSVGGGGSGEDVDQTVEREKRRMISERP